MRCVRWSVAWGMAAFLAATAAACGDGSGAATATESPRPVQAGSVTVTLSAPRYAAGDPVKVSVGNGSRDVIYTEDFQTECTIVTLQKSAAGSWTDITGCRLGRPTRTVKIEPGAADEILLDPHSSHLTAGAGKLGFGAGTYRIKFGYRQAAEPMGTQPSIAYSAVFAVG